MSVDTNDAVTPDPHDADGSAADEQRDEQAVPADSTEPSGSEEPGEDEAVQVIADIDLLQRERDDLLGTSQRLQADFENYRKRVLREQTALVERATEGLIEQLLPVLDSFELAVANLGKETDIESLRKGVELVYAELLGVLERAGLQPIAALGEPFDPNVHEALMHQHSPDVDGPTVGTVLQDGYRVGDRVVRAARVAVVDPDA